MKTKLSSSAIAILSKENKKQAIEDQQADTVKEKSGTKEEIKSDSKDNNDDNKNQNLLFEPQEIDLIINKIFKKL